MSPRRPLAAVARLLAVLCGTWACALLEGFDPVAEQIRPGALRSRPEQRLVRLSEVAVHGRVADLSDRRFGRESGRLGYFETYRFLWQVRPGIYFLELCDQERDPLGGVARRGPALAPALRPHRHPEQSRGLAASARGTRERIPLETAQQRTPRGAWTTPVRPSEEDLRRTV